MKPRFDLLLLDSGGTIFDLSVTDPLSLEQVSAGRFDRAGAAAQALGWSGDVAEFARLLAEMESQVAARLGSAYGFDKLLIEAGRCISPALRVEDARVCADMFAGPRYAQWLFAGTIDALKRFRAAGITLAVVANTVWPQSAMRRAMSGVGVEPFLDAIVCSCDIGVEKPDRRIFEHAIRVLGGAQSRRICYVGDSIRCDIKGAKAMGWATAFRRSAEPSSGGLADLEFDTWDELVAWVGA